jgi:hypothetical protein
MECFGGSVTLCEVRVVLWQLAFESLWQVAEQYFVLVSGAKDIFHQLLVVGQFLHCVYNPFANAASGDGQQS